MKKVIDETMRREAILKGSVVYIRYKDHVLFQNEVHIPKDAPEREAVGWLFQETEELLCIQYDRTIESPRYSSGKASGLILLKSCILEIHALPLQNLRRGSLSCQNDKPTNAEYALQTAERKTQPK